MAERLGGFYPGGASNPHVQLDVFPGGFMIAPCDGEAEMALAYVPEETEAGDDMVVVGAGGIALATTLADVYEL